MTRPHDSRSPAPPTGVLVCFHAHPDDEVFTTGGVMRLAADVAWLLIRGRGAQSTCLWWWWHGQDQGHPRGPVNWLVL